ncbi:MAG: hypothetical protein RL885_06185 [Planctomycetota bacterium]
MKWPDPRRLLSGTDALIAGTFTMVCWMLAPHLGWLFWVLPVVFWAAALPGDRMEG